MGEVGVHESASFHYNKREKHFTSGSFALVLVMTNPFVISAAFSHLTHQRLASPF